MAVPILTATVAISATVVVPAAAGFLARSIATLLRLGMLLGPLVVAGGVIPVHLPFNPLRRWATFNPSRLLRPGLMLGLLVVARRVISVHLPFRPSLRGCAGLLSPIGLGIALLAE